MKNNPLIFLSYSRTDKTKANAVKDHLEGQGFQVLMDSEFIRAGRLWRSQIIDGIENCLVLVILLTEDSMKSDNVRRELDIARAKKKPILPISDGLSTSKLPKEMEYQLIGLQQINYEDFISCDHSKSIILELTRPAETRVMELIDIPDIPRLEDDDGNRIYLRKKENSVGRGPDVDIDLTPWDRDHFVSRKHAVIYSDKGNWILKGVEKAHNLTYVDSAIVDGESGHPLKDGSEVTFAGIKFLYYQSNGLSD